MYKVSIIVPFYNVEEYLDKCLFRLSRQTLDNIEIILVDDGSKDNSHTIAEEYAGKYPDLFKLYIKDNGGLSDARNYGIERATGEYIGFVDSDDYPEVDMFEKLYQKAKENDSDIVVCSYNKLYSDINMGRPSKNHPGVKVTVLEVFNSYIQPASSVWDTKENLVFATPYAWNKLYRKELFDTIRYPKGQIFEDSATTYRLFLIANKIDFVGKPLYNYRIDRNNSITSKVDDKIFDIFKSCEIFMEYYKEKGGFEYFHEELECLCIQHIYARIGSLKKKAPWRLKVSFVKKAFDFLDNNYADWRNNRYYIRKRAKIKTADKFNLYEVIRHKKYLLIFCLIFYEDYEKAKKFLGSFLEKIKFVDYKGQDKLFDHQEQRLTNFHLRVLQKYELKILNTVNEFCEKNHLIYYLAEGTLLGAIRHKGFIPWDDDVDIAMPRKDYERLLKIWGTTKIDDCVLLHNSTYSQYYLPFAKIILQGNTGFRSQRKVPEQFQGPCIDIFPLDKAPESHDLHQLKNCRKMRKYRNMLLVKSKITTSKKSLVKYGLQAKIYSYNMLHKKIRMLETAYEAEDVACIANYGSSYTIDKECVPSEWYGQPRQTEFENMKLNVPREAERILQTIYENYMMLPPLEEQTCRHAFYWCGDNEE